MYPLNTHNLDPYSGKDDIWRRRAQDHSWPTEDNSINLIRASHSMEHIPAGDERIFVMNEAHRVLKPGCLFEIIVPVVVNDAGQPCWQAYADPTHVSFWCRQSFDYFCGKISYVTGYVQQWHTVSYTEVDGWEGRWTGSPLKSF